MTKTELKKIINTCYKEQLETFANPNVIKKLLLEYSDGNDKITSEELVCFTLMESLNFNRQFLESVLAKVLLDED